MCTATHNPEDCPHGFRTYPPAGPWYPCNNGMLVAQCEQNLQAQKDKDVEQPIEDEDKSDVQCIGGR